MSINFTSIDFETANPLRGSICSVGMTRVRDGLVERTEHFLVKPSAGLEFFGDREMSIHGITPRMTQTARSFPSALKAITDFVQNDYLLAHSSSFEIAAIQGACDASGIHHPHLSFLCTLDISKRMFPMSSGRYDLPSVAKRLNLGAFKHHHAGQDAWMSALIGIKAASVNSIDHIGEFVEDYGVQIRNVGLGRDFSEDNLEDDPFGDYWLLNPYEDSGPPAFLEKP